MAGCLLEYRMPCWHFSQLKIRVLDRLTLCTTQANLYSQKSAIGKRFHHLPHTETYTGNFTHHAPTTNVAIKL